MSPQGIRAVISGRPREKIARALRKISEAHERQVEVTMETLAEGPERYYT